MKYINTFDCPYIEEATDKLFCDMSEIILEYIYNNKHIYISPEIRVGLSLKILCKSTQTYNNILLNKIIGDINDMLSDESYLHKFENPMQRYNELNNELLLINKYKELSDIVSLNRP